MGGVDDTVEDLRLPESHDSFQSPLPPPPDSHDSFQRSLRFPSRGACSKYAASPRVLCENNFCPYTHGEKDPLVDLIDIIDGCDHYLDVCVHLISHPLVSTLWIHECTCLFISMRTNAVPSFYSSCHISAAVMRVHERIGDGVRFLTDRVQREKPESTKASRNTILELCRAEIDVLYSPRMMHMKLLIVDRATMVTGKFIEIAQGLLNRNETHCSHRVPALLVIVQGHSTLAQLEFSMMKCCTCFKADASWTNK